MRNIFLALVFSLLSASSSDAGYIDREGDLVTVVRVVEITRREFEKSHGLPAIILGSALGRREFYRVDLMIKLTDQSRPFVATGPRLGIYRNEAQSYFSFREVLLASSDPASKSADSMVISLYITGNTGFAVWFKPFLEYDDNPNTVTRIWDDHHRGPGNNYLLTSFDRSDSLGLTSPSCGAKLGGL